MGRFKRTAIIVLISAVTILALDLGTVIWFGLHHPTVSKADAAIVLGAKVGTPAFTHRALMGLKYFQEGKTTKLVLSGGRGPDEPVSEAEAMRTIIEHHVAKLNGKMPEIVLDTASANTVQNIDNSKALIPEAKSVIIISDCFHVARSVLIAKRAGFQRVYWDSPTPDYYSTPHLIYYYLREVVAMIVSLPSFL